MKILFWLYKSRVNKNNEVPIYCRITLEGIRKQFSTQLWVESRNFNRLKGRCKGRSELSVELNKRLEKIEVELLSIYNSMSEVFAGVTAEDVVANYKEDQKPKKELIEVFELHNERIQALIGKEYTESTYKLYENTKRLVSDFVRTGKGKIMVDRMRPSIMEDFIHYLRSKVNLQTNTVYKHVQRLNKVLNYAVRNDFLTHNVCAQVKVRQERKEINHLTQLELDAITNLNLTNQRLDRVRDYFLFMCATGLSHSDMMNLKSSNLKRHPWSELWIEGYRVKTSKKFKVLAMEKAKRIISKYYEYTLDPTKSVFEFISNQQMNRDLKSLCQRCGISKAVSTHWGRKTFSTLALSNGLPIESISAVLGHSTTSISLKSYAKLLDSKLEDDMRDLNRKLA